MLYAIFFLFFFFCGSYASAHLAANSANDAASIVAGADGCRISVVSEVSLCSPSAARGRCTAFLSDVVVSRKPSINNNNTYYYNAVCRTKVYNL